MVKKITREWAMPNKNTFQIEPIKRILIRYTFDKEKVLDPFPYPYKEDALDFLSKYSNNTVDCVVYDPPYSPRQLKECYDGLGQTLTDTKASVWSKWKSEIARVIKPGGLCISFGWNSNGIGKSNGFEIIEIMLVAHGGNHNDTIVTVEKKVNKTVVDFHSTETHNSS